MDLFIRTIIPSHKVSNQAAEVCQRDLYEAPGLGIFARGVYAIVDFVRPFFKYIEILFFDRNRIRCFSLEALSKKVEPGNQLIFENDSDLKGRIKNIYDSFCEIYRGKPSGFGTCYVRTYFATQALLNGNSYPYKENLRATLDPIYYEKHFNAGKVKKIKDDVDIGTLENGTVLIFSRPLTDKVSRMLNKLFFGGTSRQLSHVCNGVVLDGEIYILEMSKGKFKANPPQSAVIFETLENFQKRMDKAEMPRLNLFLPVGQIHPSISHPHLI